MELDQKSFSRRMEEEIRRIEETAKRLHGNDKRVLLEMARALRLERSRMEPTSAEDESFAVLQREKTQGEIISLLNRIEADVHRLEQAVAESPKAFQPTSNEADEIVNGFFLCCQVAEEVIKRAEREGMLSRSQIEDLNGQLRALVHRMIQASRKSEALLDALLHCFEARILT